MKRPIIIVAAVLVLGAGLFLLLRSDAPGPSTEPGAAEPTAGTTPSPAPGAGGPAGAPAALPSTPRPVNPAVAALQDPRALDPDPLPLDFTRPPFERQKNGTVFKTDVMRTAKDLHDREQEPLADLEILDSLVASYREIFRENPVAGENWELVEALTGKNRYKLVLIDPGHPAIRNRELVDRWGTPYRVHPISRSVMEISSAGEDRQFGTGDDIMLDEPIPIGDRGPGSEVNPRPDESEDE